MTACLVDGDDSHGPAATAHTARNSVRIVVMALSISLALPAAAQQPAPPPVFAPAPAPDPQFPPPTAAPVFVVPADPSQVAQPAPFQPPVAVSQPPVASGTPMREIFANTLAVAAQATGTTLVTGLVQAITGGLTSWFNRKLQSAVPGAPGVAVTVQAPFTPAPQSPPVAFPAPGGVSVFQPTPASPAPAFGAPAMPADPASAQFATAPPQFFDAQTGMQAVPDPVFAVPTPASPDAGALFAGLAYEVHAVLPGGSTAPVNPATHDFLTGDRFLVFYRPTLPGRMEVFNINPAGLQTQIDGVELAGGQLAQLGPYEFAAMKGEDRLRLVLRPCSTPELTLATRDIINVSASAAPAVASPAGAFALGTCGPVTRSAGTAVTRDIRKVALEGTTAFALDPVSAQERTSGQLDSREVTIVFRHR